MIHNDLSLSTLIISAMIGVVGWFLKQTLSYVVKLLIDAIKSLIAKLHETIGRVEVLDSKLAEVMRVISDHEKLKIDLRNAFDRIKENEKQINELKQ